MLTNRESSEIDQSQIVKELFVPFDFAHSKVVHVATDLQHIKENYDKYIEKLNLYFKQVIDDTKLYYENYINELKNKALLHIQQEITKNEQKDKDMIDAMRIKG
jgi:hypothetical protein